MPKTRIFTTDAVPPDEQVIAQTYCKTIRIRENGSPTSDFLVRAPGATDDQIARLAGSEHVFNSLSGSWFTPGAVVGFVSVAAGSITMAQEES